MGFNLRQIQDLVDQLDIYKIEGQLSFSKTIDSLERDFMFSMTIDSKIIDSLGWDFMGSMSLCIFNGNMNNVINNGWISEMFKTLEETVNDFLYLPLYLLFPWKISFICPFICYFRGNYGI